MNKPPLILVTAVALGFVGCTMAPKYERPAAPVPAQLPPGAAAESGQVASPGGAPAAPDLRWRDFFTDSKLQQVIATALANNRDLRLAALNVEMARALYGIQRDVLYPIVNATGSTTRQQASGDLTRPGESRKSERFDVNLGVAAWEIDFFGRLRSQKDRALQEYLATDQARRSVQTLVVSAVASAYLALAADRENLALAETTLRTQQAAHDLVRRQYEVGVATELDLRQVQTLVETARREIARYSQLVAQDSNALHLLIGAPVPAELLPTALDRVGPTREIAARTSSDVLLRRPDVLQAEAMLKAANADLGAARATFFPRISLTTFIGTASTELAGLFGSGTGTWNFTPQAVLPIFDARTWSAHKAAKVQQQMAVAQYEKTIQNAFREVADALAVRGTIEQQVSAQEALVQALAETRRLATSRYEKGVDSYLVVLDAQRNLFAAQQGLVSLRLARLASQVRLYGVLGGGADDGGTSSGPAVAAANSSQSGS